MEAQTPTQGTGNGAAAQDHSTATWTELGLSLGLPGSLETFWRCNYNENWTKMSFLLFFSMTLSSGAEWGPHKRRRVRKTKSSEPTSKSSGECSPHSWEGLAHSTPTLKYFCAEQLFKYLSQQPVTRLIIQRSCQTKKFIVWRHDVDSEM